MYIYNFLEVTTSVCLAGRRESRGLKASYGRGEGILGSSPKNVISYIKIDFLTTVYHESKLVWYNQICVHTGA